MTIFENGLSGWLKALAVIAVLALASLSAEAGPLGGTFATDGNGANMIVGLSNIMFSPSTNDLRVTASTFTYNTGSLAVGTLGTISALGLSLPIPAFITFNGTPLNFTLTGIGPGDTTDAHNCSTAFSVGQSCSLLLSGNIVSPVVLTWTAGGTALSLHLFGTVTDGTQSTNWIGDLTSSLTGALQPPFTPSFFRATSHPQDLFDYFNANPTGTITSSNQGTFSAQMVTSPVPESATLVLLGTGLVGLAGSIRRKRA